MKQLSFLIICFLFLCMGQADAQLSKKVDRFVKASGIDTFLVYSLECYHEVEYRASEYRPKGSTKPPAPPPVQVAIDTCFFDDPKFVFWNAGGKSFMKRFECSNDFETVELSNDNPLTFYLNNKDLLDNEQISLFIRVWHDCNYSLWFCSKGGTVRYSTTPYAFIPNSGTIVNSYYGYNMASRLKALIDRIQLLIQP